MIQSAAGNLDLRVGRGPGLTEDAVTFNSGWAGLRLTGLDDASGDGWGDVLALVPGTGELRIYRGTGTGSLSGWSSVGSVSAVSIG